MVRDAQEGNDCLEIYQDGEEKAAHPEVCLGCVRDVVLVLEVY